ncbi:hypothetical protein [Flavobacterium agrisoli]|uniref:Uncharacterized protein n=1 Tax=Flavobacterium agrisoli TaxID=2793066 RepID=A0A934PK30_9FLAO|nr:hypothetical protein [Flavobacterium agrisoli]MBK0368799.1 hypothetical protein [Flavobacterium agrisoli]
MDITLEHVDASKYNSIKIAIWLYFLLWIFEGALRKWILPGLATPLLVVRDPIALFIIFRAIQMKVKFINSFLIFSSLFTILSLIVTLTFGHGNLFVGIYGARIMLVNFPLIFIIGSVFNKEDVLNIGKFLLAVNILMTIIVYLQFNSPETSFVNVGVGGEGTSGFEAGAMGHYRPSGTYSFISGLTGFYTAVSVFVFYFWISKDYCNKFLLFTSTLVLIIALPLTISRGTVVAVLLVGLFATVASTSNFKMFFKFIFIVVLLVITFLYLQEYSSVFRLSTEVFMARVDNANKSTPGGSLQDSILMRALDDLTKPIQELFSKSFFEGNLGKGTNVGSQLLVGKSTFLISENEFGRLAGEQGIILGGSMIVLRIVFAITLAIKSWSLPNEERLLPFTLCGAACIAILQGQWQYPSVLAFGIIMAGLTTVPLSKKENL